MRSQSGMTLLEMVVAVGLSGVFVCLLSGLLGQTLALSSASQNQLIAVNAAEVLLESAKTTPFNVLLQNAGPPITLLVNLESLGDPSPPLRVTPVQIDLTNSSLMYGTVNGATGIVNSTNQWQKNKGNYFRGTATMQIVDAGVPNDYVQVTVAVKYTDVFGSSAAQPSQKSVSRSAYVFQNGASFQ